MFILSTVFFMVALIALVLFFFLRSEPGPNKFLKATVVLNVMIGLICFGVASFQQVSTSNVGIITSFGKVQQEVIPEGPALIAPWKKVTEVYLGQQQASTANSEAGSKDLQSVHATLSVNFTIDPRYARDLYVLNPTLSYSELLVKPAIYEIFKGVVAQYTAEELVTKRAEVSTKVREGLAARFAPIHLIVQNVNMVNFGFSKAFDEAVEKKVTAGQDAETAKTKLRQIQTEAESRIAQAKGEAEAIKIQVDAIQKAGGEDYVRLQAITKWDGKLPTYMASGAPTPFIGVK